MVTKSAVGEKSALPNATVFCFENRARASGLAATSRSQAISTSALAAGTRPPTMVSSVSPIFTWLNTEPPFWARPVMSTTLAARPSTWAAMARIEATVVTPVPPMPVNRMRRTPS
ncbi:MAG: hypothetical protein K0R83_1403, partial [Caulobacter sp.]|nr:hypothetical protein [Caulobacter sp.]